LAEGATLSHSFLQCVDENDALGTRALWHEWNRALALQKDDPRSVSVERMGLTTAVIGAGPAGMFFCIVARIRLAQARAHFLPSVWTLRLFDKRSSYARTHRLRIDPVPYERIQQSLRDPHFDRVVDFLRAHRFTPEVNALEAQLASVLEDLGVTKERLTIGNGEGELTLEALRAKLEREGTLAPSAPLTIVGADSVHSSVRALLGAQPPARSTHQRIARLRVDGADLPERLGLVTQVQFSKVLGSLVDYRRNRNGYAEVDLFLTEAEHEAVGSLGATPREPVRIAARQLSAVRAPLFRAVVDHLERGLAGPCEVRLASTFKLEHQVQPQRVFEARELGAFVFLLGDAGVSLPFFRGMASLIQGADALARVHLDLVTAPDPSAHASCARRYEDEVRAIAAAELRVVRRRAALIRALREGGRLSAMLPFPIQSWLLRAPDLERQEDRTTGWLWLNLALASAAAGCTLAGTLLPSIVAFAWARALSLPLELGGGIAYHAALSFARGPHRWVRRVWEIQIAALFAVAAILTPWGSLAHGDLAASLVALWWLVLSAAFVAGLYGFEWIVRRTVTEAALDRQG
jgi:hypothetical protein